MTLPPAKLAETFNLADKKLRLKCMKDCITAVLAPGNLHYPLLNLVSTFIDGLASGAPGSTKAQYIAYLTKNFPDLSKAVGEEVFYTKYRCKAVHEFGLAPGFAIGRDVGLKGAYVETQEIEGVKHVILNIDRLVADFLSHLEALLKAA